jgi:hypothetical protein
MSCCAAVCGTVFAVDMNDSFRHEDFDDPKKGRMRGDFTKPPRPTDHWRTDLPQIGKQ